MNLVEHHHSHTVIQLNESETAFDRFSVTWSAPALQAKLKIYVRFRFLSTDFSHSKGVKGVPVRLVSQTQMHQCKKSSDLYDLSLSDTSYSLIKLFRDRGAERKLANDKHHLERSISKLRTHTQQLLCQVENDSNRKIKLRPGRGKNVVRLRDTSMLQPNDCNTLAKSYKCSTVPNQSIIIDHAKKLDKITAMEDILTSIKPITAFMLSTEHSDIDTRVGLTGNATDAFMPQRMLETDQQVMAISSSDGRDSPNKIQDSCQITPPIRGHPQIQLMKLHGKPVWVSEAEPLKNCSLYLAPPELCVYISICRPADDEDAFSKQLNSENSGNERFLAVYILHRTLQQFVEVISRQVSNYLITKKEIKWKEVIHIEKSGRRVIVNDELIKRLPQGQEIYVSFSEQRKLADLSEDATEYTLLLGF